MRLNTFLRRLVSYSKLITINLVVFLIIFVTLEIAARSYSYFFTGHGFFRQNDFISPWITTNDYPPPMINDNGDWFFRHRTSPTQLQKPEGTVRIISVGGSTTVNDHAFRKDGIDYSSELEKNLNELAGNGVYEVLNAGGDGYSTAQSLINIEFRLVEFHPDIILLMHNINDCSVNFFDGGATPDYSNKYLKPYFLAPELQGGLSFSGLLLQSRLLVKLGLPRILANKSGDLDTSADYAKGIPFFRRNLESIAAVCKANDIHLVLLTQPYSLEPHPFVNTTAILDYSRVVQSISEDLDIDLIDMYGLFGHDSDLFIDPFHYSTAGIRRFSTILSRELALVLPSATARGESGQDLSSPHIEETATRH